MATRHGKAIPVIIDLLREVRRCQYAVFLPGHPIRDVLRDLIRVEMPLLKARIAARNRERQKHNIGKPVQLVMWK